MYYVLEIIIICLSQENTNQTNAHISYQCKIYSDLCHTCQHALPWGSRTSDMMHAVIFNNKVHTYFVVEHFSSLSY